MKPESGCSGPFSPSTARCANEPAMNNDKTRKPTPTPSTSAAAGVGLPSRRNIVPNAFGVRLFKV